MKDFCKERETLKNDELWPLITKYVTLIAKGRSVRKKVQNQKVRRENHYELRPLQRPPQTNYKLGDGFKVPAYIDPIVNLLLNPGFDDGSEDFKTFKQYATKFFTDNPQKRSRFCKLVFEDVIEAAKHQSTYQDLLLGAS